MEEQGRGSREKGTRSRMAQARPATALLLVAAAVAAVGGTALGQGGRSPEPRGAGGRASAAAERAIAARRTPEARASRERSRVAFRRLDRRSALLAGRREHPKVLREPAHPPVNARTSAKIAGFLSDYAARLDPPKDGGPAAIVSSSIPLRAERNGRKRPVDLDVQRRRRGFAPANPAVPVKFPAGAGGRTTVGDKGLSITPIVDRPKASGALSGDTVFYANALPDTDVMVKPTAVGAESFAQLRSPASPDVLRYRLSIPRGMRLKAAGRGAFEVLSGKRTYAVITTPTAWGADGAAVETKATLRGKVLSLRVTHREADVAYPVMVDPNMALVMGYQWRPCYTSGGTSNCTNGWSFWNWNWRAWGPFFPFAGDSSWFGRGLYSYLQCCSNAQWYGQYQYGFWRFEAPGTVAITEAEFHAYYHETPDSNMCMQFGLAKRGSGWVQGPHAFTQLCSNTPTLGYQRRWCTDPGCGDTYNYYYNPEYKAVDFGEVALSGAWRSYYTNYLGGIALYFVDPEAPTLSIDAPPTNEWVRDRQRGITLTADDPGLGIAWSRIQLPYGPAWDGARSPTGNCQPTGPCDMKQTTTTKVGNLPEGPNTITYSAADPANQSGAHASTSHTTTHSRTLLVDTEGPTTVLTGTLKEANGKTVTGWAPVTATATDGAESPSSARRSGVKSIELYVDDKQAGAMPGTQTASNAAVTRCAGSTSASCSLSAPLAFDAADYEDGRHKVFVRATDFAGNVKDSETLTIETAAHGPTVQVLDHENRPKWLASPAAATVSATDFGRGVTEVGLRSDQGGTKGELYLCKPPLTEPPPPPCASSRERRVDYSLADPFPEGTTILRGYAKAPGGAPAAAPRGLQAEYFGTMDFTGSPLTRRDSMIDLDWGGGAPDPAIGGDRFSARWTGVLTPRHTDTYTFSLEGDDQIRLFVDDVHVTGNFNGGQLTPVPMPLVKDRPYRIRVEMAENTGNARARLLWSSALETSGTTTPVPGDRLRPPTKGLLAEIFTTTDLTTKPFRRIDATVQTAGTPRPPDLRAPGASSIRWSASLRARHSETHTFHVTSDRGIRLWADGRKLIDDPTVTVTPTQRSGQVALKADTDVDLRLERFGRRRLEGVPANMRLAGLNPAASTLHGRHRYAVTAIGGGEGETVASSWAEVDVPRVAQPSGVDGGRITGTLPKTYYDVAVTAVDAWGRETGTSRWDSVSFTTGIRATWNPVPGAVGYRVYARNTYNPSQFSEVSVTGQATSFANLTSLSSSSQRGAPKSTNETDNEAVDLAWSAVPEASGYRLYRHSYADGVTRRIAQLSGTTYTDTNSGSTTAAAPPAENQSDVPAAPVQLEWSSPSQPREVVPADRLAPPAIGLSSPWPVMVDRSNPTVSARSDLFKPNHAAPRDYDIHFDAADARSGVKWVDLVVNGVRRDRKDYGCTAATGCTSPRSDTFRFNPAGMNEGQDHDVWIVAHDAVDRTATAKHVFRIDDDPELEVTGGLRSSPLATGRSLKATATDQIGGLTAIDVFRRRIDGVPPVTAPGDWTPVEAERVQTPVKDCGGAKTCETSYTLHDEPESGRYQFMVRARDNSGNKDEEVWTVEIVRLRSGDRTRLGLEQWFELDGTDAGGDSTLYVNGDTGNVVWHSLPIVNPGRGLTTAVNLTYNSHERGGVLGTRLSQTPVVAATATDQNELTDDLLGASYREAGVGFSIGIGGPTRVNEPLGGVLLAGLHERRKRTAEWPAGSGEGRVSLTDADGTRHRFTRQEGETAWKSPAGVNMRLRYTGPSVPSDTIPNPVDVFRFTIDSLDTERTWWELLRPDGVRHEFDAFGYLRETNDRNGNELDYHYRAVSAVTGQPCDAPGQPATHLLGQVQGDVGLCVPQLLEVRQPTWASTGPARFRRIALTYESPRSTLDSLFGRLGGATSFDPIVFALGDGPRIRTIEDASRRTYTLEYHTGALDGHLKELRENSSPAAGETSRVTRFKYGEQLPAGSTAPQIGDVQQLTDVVPVTPGGAEEPATRIEYAPRVTSGLRPPAPREPRVVTKRSDAIKVFRFPRSADPGLADFAVFENTTGDRYATRQTVVDERGRPTRVTESTSTLASRTAAPVRVVSQGVSVTTLAWSPTENKVTDMVEAPGEADERTTHFDYLANGSGAVDSQTVTAGGREDETDFEYYENRGFVTDLETVTGPGNRTWTFGVDANGNVTSETDPANQTAETEYDVRGVVLLERDRLDRETRYADHDLGGLPQTVTLPPDPGLQRVWRYRYDARGDVTQVMDPRGDAARMDEDVTTDVPFRTVLTHDGFGRLVRERIPRASGRGLDASDGPAFVQRSRSFDRDGEVRSMTDERNELTSILRDAMGMPTTIVEPGSNGPERTTFVYDAAQRLIARTLPLGFGATQTADAIRGEHVAACEEAGAQGSQPYTTRHCLDHRGRALATVAYSQRSGDIARRIDTFTYDHRDNVTGHVDANRNTTRAADGTQVPLSIHNAIAGAGERARQRESTTYDHRDRPLEATVRPTEAGAQPRVVVNEYDATGDLVRVTDRDDAGDRVVERDYDATGRLISETDPLGRMTCWKRRADGMVTAATTPRGTDDAHDVCADAGRQYENFTTRFDYDNADDVIRRTIPHAEDQYGEGRQDVLDWDVEYVRDVVGNPEVIVDGRGNQFRNWFYDGGELRGTERPSWWTLAGGGGEANPAAGGQFSPATDAADVDVADDGPRIVESADGPTNAQQSSEEPDKPVSLGQSDFGEVSAAETPGLLPEAGTTQFRYDPQMRLRFVVPEAVDGHSRELRYDPAGRMASKLLPLDAQRTIQHDFEYDADGNLATVREDWQAGRRLRTAFTYDGYDRRISQDAEGAGDQPMADDASVREITRFAYDANANLAELTTARGTRYVYEHDSLDRLVTERNPAGETWRHAYDRHSDRTAEIAPHDPAEPAADHTTTFAYDRAGQLESETARVENPDAPRAPGHPQGRVLHDVQTRYGYDADGNLETTNAPGAPERTITTTTHDGRGLPWRTTVEGDTETPARRSITEFDANGNLRRTVNPAGMAGLLPRVADDGTDAAAADAHVRVYDQDDLLVEELLPFRDEPGEGGARDVRFRRSWHRDTPLRRVTAIERPHATGVEEVWQTRYCHNAAGWIVGATEEHRRGGPPDCANDPLFAYEYDEQGNQTRRHSRNADVNSDGYDLRWTYWPNGLVRRRTGVRLLDNGGGDDVETRRDYDYHYNPNGSLVGMVDSDARRDQPGDQVRTTRIDRDGAERETRIDERWSTGTDVQNEYEPHTGLLAVRRTDGFFDTTGAYGGAAAKATSFAYDVLGRETSMTVDAVLERPNRVTTTRWHDNGLLLERAKAPSVRTGEQGAAASIDRWHWNARGEATLHQRVRRERGGGETHIPHAQDYDYDANGNRTTDERGEYVFNARDHLVRWKRGVHFGRQDRVGWFTTYTVDGTGAVHVEEQWQPDENGEPDMSGAAEVRVQSLYRGDRLRRRDVIDATVPGETADSTVQTFRYDDAGNVQRIYVQAAADHGSGPPAETALSIEDCEDADHLVSRSITRYCHDAFGRQVFSSGHGIDDPTYVEYDGLDRRDNQIRDNVEDDDYQRRDYTYVGTSEDLSVERVTGVDARRKSFDYDSAGDRQGIEVEQDEGRSVRYDAYAKDVNGSVVGLEEPDGSLLEEKTYPYDPYGAPDVAGGDPEQSLHEDARDNPFRFQGFYHDAHTQTYDMHARHYRPDIGRFLSRDQYASAVGEQALDIDLMTQNRYAFAGGNPVTNVEFDGHRSDDDMNPRRRAGIKKSKRNTAAGSRKRTGGGILSRVGATVGRRARRAVRGGKRKSARKPVTAADIADTAVAAGEAAEKHVRPAKPRRKLKPVTAGDIADSAVEAGKAAEKHLDKPEGIPGSREVSIVSNILQDHVAGLEIERKDLQEKYRRESMDPRKKDRNLARMRAQRKRLERLQKVTGKLDKFATGLDATSVYLQAIEEGDSELRAAARAYGSATFSSFAGWYSRPCKVIKFCSPIAGEIAGKAGQKWWGSMHDRYADAYRGLKGLID